jgi:ParB-like chromosome segregation protein Spo0J
MEFQKVKISDLKPAEYNPRIDLQPNDKEYQQILVSIDEFGYVDPIIVNQDMTIIGGHQRVKVLRDLGYEEIEAVVVDLDKTREKALNIALNKITGRWDFIKLESVLEKLKAVSFNIEITGWNEKELIMMVNKLNTDDDNILVKDTFQVVIDCDSEVTQKEAYEKLTGEGYTCRVLTY